MSHTLMTALFIFAVFCVGLCARLESQGLGTGPATKPVVRNAPANAGPTLLQWSRDRKWEAKAEPMKMFGNLYFVGTKGIGVWLIQTTDGLILMNTAMPGSGPMIEESIKKLGFKVDDIKLILLCHAHVDHAGGIAYMKKVTGAKLVLMKKEVDVMESGGKSDFHYSGVSEFEFDPAKVDMPVNDGDEIKLGDVTIKALLTAGHSQGDTTYVMKHTDEGKEYTVVFPDGTSVNPGYRLVNNPSYPGIMEDYQRTLTTLESLKSDIWLSPHNDTTNFDAKRAKSATEGIKAWVDPDGFKNWVATQRRNIENAINTEKLGGGGR
jgi:metallo-beta-lactamase class B